MADITCKVSVADLNRITSALTQSKSVIRATAPKYRWTLDILDHYKDVVASAMGSVKGTGGSVKLSYRGVTKNKYWEPLTEATIGAYQLDAAVLSIWKYMGGTQGAVKVHTEEASYGGFAGILDPDIVASATAMEEGGMPVNRHPNYEGEAKPAYARPLFSIANSLFETVITKAMNDPASQLYKELCSDVISSIKHLWVSK